MKSKRVLYISQEIYPYLPESEISTIARKLPQQIMGLGNEVRLFMPRFGVINERRNQLHEVKRLSGINMIVNDNDHPLIIKVASIQAARMQVYFIDNDDFFKRKNLYGVNAAGINDNDERAIFFVRGVLEAIKKLRWIPDIIHCQGVFTALAVLYLKKVYQDDPCLKKAKVVFSVYNETTPVEIPESLFDKLKFDNIKPAALQMMDGHTDLEALLRLAVSYAHGVVIGGNISSELQDFISKSDKPLLQHPAQEEEYGELYNEFYDQLL